MDFIQVELISLVVHNVGNKLRDEGISYSKNEVRNLDERANQLLLQYFLTSFKSEEIFNFYHPSDLKYNEIFSFSKKIFKDKELLLEVSKDIAVHLYEHSSHPKIKAGELSIVYLSNCVLDGEMIDGIGIFKTESKETFLKMEKGTNSYKINYDEGIDINKLDKGCIIFNTNKDSGYSICIVDNQNKSLEAQYWKDDFLKVRLQENEYNLTKSYLTLCKEYVTNRLPEEFEIERTDQIDLLNRSVDYFKNNANFKEQDFAKEIFDDPSLIKSFEKFTTEFRENNDIDVFDNFAINSQAVKKQSKVFKSILKLDKNFHIYVHGNKDLIERGFDHEKGMNYYKVYFKDEQ
ncbi:MAG TPA: nucleoid-associated protein [Verrucomicrobiae bacterium]|nr:nucleoid-associated protein [Verrucomicrobiae bacterium]